MSLGNNAIVSIYRLSVGNGQEFYPENPTAEGIDCYLEQIQPELAPAFNERSAFKSFKLFSEGFIDFKRKDKIVDQRGREFIK